MSAGSKACQQLVKQVGQEVYGGARPFVAAISAFIYIGCGGAGVRIAQLTHQINSTEACRCSGLGDN